MGKKKYPFAPTDGVPRSMRIRKGTKIRIETPNAGKTPSREEILRRAKETAIPWTKFLETDYRQRRKM